MIGEFEVSLKSYLGALYDDNVNKANNPKIGTNNPKKPLHELERRESYKISQPTISKLSTVKIISVWLGFYSNKQRVLVWVDSEKNCDCDTEWEGDNKS